MDDFTGKFPHIFDAHIQSTKDDFDNLNLLIPEKHLFDKTPIAGTIWSNLKETAMTENYQ